MFPRNYFPPRFFAPRYFEGPSDAPPPPDPQTRMAPNQTLPFTGFRIGFHFQFLPEGDLAMNTVQTKSFDMALAEADRAAWNANSPSLGLIAADFVPSNVMTTADIVPAAYDEYVRLGVSFGPVFVDSAGKLTSLCNREFYSDATGTISETIYGAYLQNTVTGILAAAKFDAVVPMGQPGQAVPLALILHGGILTMSQQG